MADTEHVTESSSCSQMETVQPFTIEESPGLKVGVESPKVLDSSTLICTSIGKSPIVGGSGGTTKLPHSKRSKHSLRSRTNSNMGISETTSHSNGSSGSETTSDSTSSSTGGVGDADDDEDDFATNRSAKSTASEPMSSGSSSEGKTNMTNSNKDDFDDSEEDVTPDAPVADSHSVEEDTEADGRLGAGSSTEAGATGVQSTDSATEDQSDSVFANLADSAEAALTDAGVNPGAATPQRQSVCKKNELANLIEKAILDFCSSRTVETMRRMFAGVTNDTETLQRDGGRHDDKSANTPHPVTGELVKEGVIIGDIDVFAPRCQREYILPVNDTIITTLLKEPGIFRAICHKTRCQIEVTRRLLNRKLCIGGSWHKYMIIRVVGPTFKSIQNCDILLQKAVKGYIQRKEYFYPAVCRMFLREEVPDNADLYHSFQRTGGTSNRFGFLKLESPYRTTATRSLGICPWKFGLWKPGKLAFSMPGARLCMTHVYPSQGYQTTSALEPEYQGVHATERVHALHEIFQVKRQSALNLKRNLTIPVCR